jgi:hypothetical protein
MDFFNKPLAVGLLSSTFTPTKNPQHPSNSRLPVPLVKDSPMPTSKKQIATDLHNTKKSTGKSTPESKVVTNCNTRTNLNPRSAPPQKTFYRETNPFEHRYYRAGSKKNRQANHLTVQFSN